MAAAPNYGAALLMVAATDLVGLVADKLGSSAITALGLIRLPLPFDLPLLEIDQAWHVRYDADAAHRWLRAQVRQAVAEILSS